MNKLSVSPAYRYCPGFLSAGCGTILQRERERERERETGVYT
jgi:hypothetical protein